MMEMTNADRGSVTRQCHGIRWSNFALSLRCVLPILLMVHSISAHCTYSTQHQDVNLQPQDAIKNRFIADNIPVGRRSLLGMAAGAGCLAFGIPTEAALAMTNDPTTGIALPDPGEIEASIPKEWADVENPFTGSGTSTKSMFGRLDSKPDSIFYTDPRFVEHVDETAVRTMTEYISKEATKKGDSVLDLCSSWTSHITGDRSKELTRVSGLGMNAKELEANPALTDWKVQDLNADPILPYEDDSFDVVVCQLSIDYLTKPLEVLQQVSRVLKPGGRVHIMFSNRLFLSKAVGLWTGADDIDHAYFVGCYLHFCDGRFNNIAAQDLSTRKGRNNRIAGDPLYVVSAVKGA